jgi:hypothetical protein
MADRIVDLHARARAAVAHENLYGVADIAIIGVVVFAGEGRVLASLDANRRAAIGALCAREDLVPRDISGRDRYLRA